MDHVSGLSDGVIEFLTDSDPDSIGNRTMNQQVDGVLRVKVAIRAEGIAEVVIKSPPRGSLLLDIGP